MNCESVLPETAPITITSNPQKCEHVLVLIHVMFLSQLHSKPRIKGLCEGEACVMLQLNVS